MLAQAQGTAQGEASDEAAFPAGPVLVLGFLR